MRLDGYYFYKSRFALLAILKSIGLNKILLPRYYCHDVTDFLQENNIEVSLYEIDSKFQIIYESIFNIEAYKKNDVIILPTYFGDTSNLKYLDLLIDKIVIVDNVHSLNCVWQKKSVMLEGDFSISSIWKYTGNDIDGAIMLVNNPKYISNFKKFGRYIVELHQGKSTDSALKFSPLKNNFIYKILRLLKEIYFSNYSLGKVDNAPNIDNITDTINFSKISIENIYNVYYQELALFCGSNNLQSNTSFLIPINKNKIIVILRYLFSFDNKFQVCKWPMHDSRIKANSHSNQLWKKTFFLRIFT
jgi:hypothetical protein